MKPIGETAAKQIGVLLVEDDPDDVLVISAGINSQGGRFRIETADRLAAALHRLETPGIDVILLDLTLPDSTGLESFRRLQGACGDVPIVVLTGLDSEFLALRLVQEGAQDYLVKGEVSGPRLGRSLYYAVERYTARTKLVTESRSQGDGRRPLGRILGFAGAKGGVGTTTVALNVAAVLAGQVPEVTVVELAETGGTLALHFGRQTSDELSGLLRLPPERISAEELGTRLSRASCGIRYLPGRPGLGAEEITPQQAEAILNAAARLSDYTVLDLTARPCRAAQTAARRCERLSVVLDREPLSVRCARVVVEQVLSWGVNPARLGAVVVNRTALSAPMTLAEIGAQLSCPVLAVIPPAADACIMADSRGLPLVLLDPEHLAASMLVELAGRLTGRSPLRQAG
jgi:MinD-like ATPase involved in chromosome partitioning or flagellar assembly/CheY-like chemotaxis protein